MFNNKPETEEKDSNRSLSQASGSHAHSKRSDARHTSEPKHKSDYHNQNQSDNSKAFRPKSIGHYILGCL